MYNGVSFIIVMVEIIEYELKRQIIYLRAKESQAVSSYQPNTHVLWVLGRLVSMSLFWPRSVWLFTFPHNKTRSMLTLPSITNIVAICFCTDTEDFDCAMPCLQARSIVIEGPAGVTEQVQVQMWILQSLSTNRHMCISRLEWLSIRTRSIFVLAPLETPLLVSSIVGKGDAFLLVTSPATQGIVEVTCVAVCIDAGACISMYTWVS